MEEQQRLPIKIVSVRVGKDRVYNLGVKGVANIEVQPPMVAVHYEDGNILFFYSPEAGIEWKAEKLEPPMIEVPQIVPPNNVNG